MTDYLWIIGVIVVLETLKITRRDILRGRADTCIARVQGSSGANLDYVNSFYDLLHAALTSTPKIVFILNQ